jgi:hypothetical protein
VLGPRWGRKASSVRFFVSPPHSNEFEIFILSKHRALFCPIAMSSDESQGYPVRRNNSCSAGESVCGRTWGTFYACCPGSSQCLDSHSTEINNFICCRGTLNCSGLLADTPTCADTSWDLYNSTGYFCCEPNHAGFHVEGTVSVGCVDPGAARNLSYSALKPSSTGQWSLYCHTVPVANVRFV